MMSDEALDDLAAEIMSLGYDEATASDYAALIGDLPLTDEAGKIIVRDETGTELARLPLKFFGSK